MRTIQIALLAASLLTAGVAVHAQTQSEAQRDFDRNMEAARQEYQRQQADKVREQMRDTTHDNRLGVGTVGGHEASVGGDVGADNASVNVRISTDDK